ncbi:hypothetical protein EUA06_05350 [Nocardioides glacieisoli]|uniref:Uncharacterized protein n=1 Tax=Nocardioides glacieisoli TaxID=1168730 RepID=A0A4Q2RWP2_9ACTN|nr:hypothetical protein [Nocardioides glacieisoli]RYB92384.1 hypothetical protein EUA06_05350 [Nocardioides glacieisoli]
MSARPTRRTLVRSAAWSVPVVALAATAPAFAASTATTGFTGVVGTAEKWSNGNEKHVSWDLQFTNGPVAIDEIRITFTYTPTSGGPFESFEIYGYAATTGARDTTWTYPAITVPTSTLTATHLNDIPANSTYRLHTDFAGGDNAAGTVQATAQIKYVGSTTFVPQTVGPLNWGSGSKHVHPA